MADDDSGLAHDRRAFLDWLELRSEHIVDAMVEAVCRAAPAVIAGEGDQALLRSALTSHLPLVYAVVEAGDEHPRLTLPKAAERWARHMARIGVDLSEIYVAYDAAADVIIERYIAASHGDPTHLAGLDRAAALEATVAWVLRYLRIAMAKAANLFDDELNCERRQRPAEIAAGIERVLSGDADFGSTGSWGGYDLSSNHLAIALWTEEPGAGIPELERLLMRLRTLLKARRAVSFSPDTRTLFGWLEFASGEPLDRLPLPAMRTEVPIGTRVGVGLLHSGVRGFRRSHHEALLARRFAEHPRHTAQPVVRFLDTAMLTVASADIETTTALVRAKLGSLIDPQHEQLLRTLGIWLDELGSPSRTARRLGLHTNSVVKRMERVDSLLLERADPSDLFLRLAVELRPLISDADS